jgi:ribosome-associated protein
LASEEKKSRKMAILALNAMKEKKAEDIRIIDIEKISTLADYFLIASGTNRNQVHAIADFVEEKLGRAGYEVQHTEGYESAHWILLDYGDIIVHIFDRKNRLYYDLDRIWRDGMAISEDELGKEED